MCFLVVERKIRHPLNRWKTDGPVDERFKIMMFPASTEKKVGEAIFNRAQMLAFILYTGCDCTYDMSAAERDRDFDTWPWFSFLLQQAIFTSDLARQYKSNQNDVLYSGTHPLQR